MAFPLITVGEIALWPLFLFLALWRAIFGESVPRRVGVVRAPVQPAPARVSPRREPLGAVPRHLLPATDSRERPWAERRITGSLLRESWEARTDGTASRDGIVFRALDPVAGPWHASGGVPGVGDLGRLRDAFTGLPLDPARELIVCPVCRVIYQRESVDVLRAENSGRCVNGCDLSRAKPLEPRSGPKRPSGRVEPTPPGPRPTPPLPRSSVFAEVPLATLENYRALFGRVVTFAGRVERVERSRRGCDFAVLFEPAPWNHALKMIVFGSSVELVGGERFLESLAGMRLCIQGPLLDHPRHGPEIVVFDDSMILEVES